MTRCLSGFLVLALVLSALPLAAQDRKPAVETIDAFIASIKAATDLPSDNVQAAIEAVEELKADPPSHSAAISVGLRELYPEYAEALVELADENLEAALPKLEKLAKSENPYLATDARFFLARAQMLHEKFEQALPALESVLGKDSQYTVQQGDATFLLGFCQAHLLKRKEAIETFTKFEKEFPDAPERMRILAWRTLQQLQLVQDETISDVQARMDYSRRKLTLKDSGKETQEEQKKIVDILAKLIKEAEDQEGGGGGGGGGGSGRQQGGGQSDGSGAGGGQGGNTGGHGSGSDNSQDTDKVNRLRRTGPESGWSKLRPHEREKIFSALKEKYPARYEKLVEQYYKSFDEE